MNIERAKEIFDSKGVIEVKHKNKSVWIESVDDVEGMVKVRNLNSNKSHNVDVSELIG